MLFEPEDREILCEVSTLWETYDNGLKGHNYI